jgi:hypothetical protein
MTQAARLFAILCVCLSASSASAQTLYLEDFGRPPCAMPLAAPAWFGKDEATVPFSAVTVVDPTNRDNCVLTFNALTAFGDAFSRLIEGVPGRTLVMEFDYLGRPELGGVPGDLGGTIGISEGFAAGHRWFAGTDPDPSIERDPLVDDGRWHHYSFEFDPFQPAVGCCGYTGSGRFRVMLEDHLASAGIPGDSYFDNVVIRLSTQRVTFALIPIPSLGGIPVVAILSDPSFDATTVDVARLRFGHSGSEAGVLGSAPFDIDNDGDADMVVLFDLRQSRIVCGDAEVFLLGATTAGVAFEGSLPIDLSAVGCS